MSDFATWSDLEALKRNLEFTKDDLLKKQQQATTDEDKLKSRDEIAAELERMSLVIGRHRQPAEGPRVGFQGAGSGAQPRAPDGVSRKASVAATRISTRS